MSRPGSFHLRTQSCQREKQLSKGNMGRRNLIINPGQVALFVVLLELSAVSGRCSGVAGDSDGGIVPLSEKAATRGFFSASWMKHHKFENAMGLRGMKRRSHNSHTFSHAGEKKRRENKNPISLALNLRHRGAGEYHQRRRLLGKGELRLEGAVDQLGYYYVTVQIGTPPQTFALITDTGSTLTYVPSASCVHCGHKHQDPRFQPKDSSTYWPIACNSPDCMTGQCDSKKDRCLYHGAYAEDSTASGYMASDILSFPNMDGGPGPVVNTRVTFGCLMNESGDIYMQEADGIMGLGRDTQSLANQLVKARAMDDSFSLCFGEIDVGGGALLLGAHQELPNTVWVPLPPPSRFDRKLSSYYILELKGIIFGKETVSIPFYRIKDGRAAMIDSGTTFTYLPSAAFYFFTKAVLSEVKFPRVEGPDKKFKDLCFGGIGSNASRLTEVMPAMSFVFAGNQTLKLSAQNVFFRHKGIDGAYCLGVFQTNEPAAIIGGIAVRGMMVTYDRMNDRIGFAPADCARAAIDIPTPPASSSPLRKPSPAGFLQKILEAEGTWGIDKHLVPESERTDSSETEGEEEEEAGDQPGGGGEVGDSGQVASIPEGGNRESEVPERGGVIGLEDEVLRAGAEESTSTSGGVARDVSLFRPIRGTARRKSANSLEECELCVSKVHVHMLLVTDYKTFHRSVARFRSELVEHLGLNTTQGVNVISIRSIRRSATPLSKGNRPMISVRFSIVANRPKGLLSSASAQSVVDQLKSPELSYLRKAFGEYTTIDIRVIMATSRVDDVYLNKFLAWQAFMDTSQVMLPRQWHALVYGAMVVATLFMWWGLYWRVATTNVVRGGGITKEGSAPTLALALPTTCSTDVRWDAYVDCRCRSPGVVKKWLWRSLQQGQR